MNRSLRAALIGCAGMLLLNACAGAGPAPSTSAAPRTTPSPVAASVTPTPPFSPTLPRPSPASTTTPPGTALPELECKLNRQFPANGTKLEPRTDFTVRWTITNTGSAAWQPGEVDLDFVGGTAMHFSPVMALPEVVAQGQSITLSVDMKALRNTSSYVTTWALRQGDAHFCRLSLLIYVQWENDSGGNP
jgi:hypothetical protein